MVQIKNKMKLMKTYESASLIKDIAEEMKQQGVLNE